MSMDQTPPELRGARFENDDDAPRRRRPLVTLVAMLCIAALALAALSGLSTLFL
ncbi:MAG: hypothetical protein Q4G34_07420 [Micrococcus sp.]|nr:hypothetical protein [Micrococcus sp.]